MPKTYKTIHYSQLEYKELDFHPFKRVRGVCYYDGFWTLLAQDVLKSWHKGLKWLHRHYRKEFVLGSIFLLALIPAPHRVKALSPPQTQPLYIQSVSHLEPLQPLSVPVPQLVSPIPEPQPVAAPAPVVSGCVIYHSGDYYLDKIMGYESTYNSCATNGGGCFGLLQACPGAPLKAACGGDPTCQIAWFQANKTGGRSWAQVWQHELDFGWW